MITKTDAEKLIAYFNTIGSPSPAPIDIEHLARTVIALWDRVEAAETIARQGKDTIATVLLLEIAAALADHERVVLTRDETSLGPRIMDFAAILKETTHD